LLAVVKALLALLLWLWGGCFKVLLMGFGLPALASWLLVVPGQAPFGRSALCCLHLVAHAMLHKLAAACTFIVVARADSGGSSQHACCNKGYVALLKLMY
jgi:hypothetical protein